MGQKHNRRRTRQRPQHRANAVAKRCTQLQADPTLFPSFYQYAGPRGLLLYPRIPQAGDGKTSHAWQNRCTTSQTRERGQYQPTTRFETEQCRLFGGEPGDDVELCYRMLEFFGGLDYIDT